MHLLKPIKINAKYTKNSFCKEHCSKLIEYIMLLILILKFSGTIYYIIIGLLLVHGGTSAGANAKLYFNKYNLIKLYFNKYNLIKLF